MKVTSHLNSEAAVLAKIAAIGGKIGRKYVERNETDGNAARSFKP